LGARRVILSGSRGWIVRGRLRQFGLRKEEIETGAKRFLFVLALGERQQEGIAQNASVRQTDLGHRPHRVDAFGGETRTPAPRAARKKRCRSLSSASAEDVLTAALATNV